MPFITFTPGNLAFLNWLIPQKQTEFSLGHVLLYCISLKIWNYLHTVGRLKRTRDNHPRHCSLNLENEVYDVLSIIAGLFQHLHQRAVRGKFYSRQKASPLKALLILGAKRWFLVPLKMKNKIKYQVHQVTLLEIHIHEYWFYRI